MKLSDLDKSRMKRKDYSINISVKKIKYPSMTLQKVSISTFPHYKAMENISCHSNQSSYPTGIKNNNITLCPLPVDAIIHVVCNMERIGLTTSEEMSFETVDGRTDAGCLYIL